MSEPNHSYNSKAVSKHITKAWIQTLLGISLLLGLAGLALFWFGLNLSWVVVLLSVLVLFPIYGWFNSDKLVKKMMRCQDPHPDDPEHQRLVRLVDELFPLTGLKVKPPVLVSPMPVPNAFATGRNQSKAFIAATEGLLYLDLSDEEIKAILAHELAHIKSNDVTITSFTAMLGSLFALVLANGIPSFFNSLFDKDESKDLLEKLEHKATKKKRFFATGGGFTGMVLMLIVFFVASFLAKLVTLFVSRSRESHADALAVSWTKNPCALSSSLQKITLWMSMNNFDFRIQMLMGGLAPMLFVSLHDDEFMNDDDSFSSRLRRWWQRVGQQHPPIPDRLKVLDEYSGSVCPRFF